MPGDREKVMKAGCNGYIEKPIDPDTFVAKVEQHLIIRVNRGKDNDKESFNCR
jgi:DNA-binding response OmpR family regulator